MNRLETLSQTMAVLFVSFSIAQAEQIWIEAESPVSMPSMASTADWGKPDLVSGKLLIISLVEKENAVVPEKGITIRYDFECSDPGTFELWNRVVFSSIRAPFRWRVKEAEWQGN